MVKKVVLVRGACGAGKTYWIQKNRLRLDKVIDYATLQHVPWDQRADEAIKKLGRGTTYIEAIFGIGSPSYVQIVQKLRDLNIETQEVIIHRPFEKCQEAIEMDADARKPDRMTFLQKYWFDFERYIRDCRDIDFTIPQRVGSKR